jgi:hypothetical protein
MEDIAALATEPERMQGTTSIECRTLAKTYAHLRVRDPSAEARLRASLAAEGQTSPVIVAGLEQLGRDTVTAIVLGLHEVDALVYCHRLETSRRRSILEDGWLIREIQGHGFALRLIAQVMHRSTSWVSRRLGLVRAMPTSVEEAIRRGVVPPHAAMKSLLPLARANRAQCEQLVKQLGGERVTTRQVARLYAAWRDGDAEQKERIVEKPRLFLRAIESTEPAEPRDEIGWLVQQLGAAREALARADESLGRAVEVDPLVSNNARLRRALRPVATAWEALQTKMENHDAGPRHADGDLAAAC